METFCGKMGCFIIFLIRLSVVSNHCVLFNRFILLKNLLVLLNFFLQRTFFDRNIRQFLIEILDTLRSVLKLAGKMGTFLVISSLQVQECDKMPHISGDKRFLTVIYFGIYVEMILYR